MLMSCRQILTTATCHFYPVCEDDDTGTLATSIVVRCLLCSQVCVNKMFSVVQTAAMCRSPSQISLMSQNDFDFRQLFTHVGTYRGTIVAIRRVNKKHVELTRSVRKELKTVNTRIYITVVGCCCL